MSGDCRTSFSRVRPGFTLIELLVVIGIILLLVALTITVGTGVLRQSEVRETQNTLRLLEVAVQEWEVAADRQVLYGINGEPCVPSPGNPSHERYDLQQVHGATHTWSNESQAVEDAQWTTDRLWAILRRTSTVRDIIARVNPDFVIALEDDDEVTMHANDALNDTQPSLRILDAWDRPILAVLPGRVYATRCGGAPYNEPYLRDDDGTVRTPYENRFGVSADRRIFFVSAGPSGVFGGLHLNTAREDLSSSQRDDIADAADNVYSYPVHTESARP